MEHEQIQTYDQTEKISIKHGLPANSITCQMNYSDSKKCDNFSTTNDTQLAYYQRQPVLQQQPNSNRLIDGLIMSGLTIETNEINRQYGIINSPKSTTSSSSTSSSSPSSITSTTHLNQYDNSPCRSHQNAISLNSNITVTSTPHMSKVITNLFHHFFIYN